MIAVWTSRKEAERAAKLLDGEVVEFTENPQVILRDQWITVPWAEKVTHSGEESNSQ